MIHIFHTPAATLARRRRHLAGQCCCWVMALGSLAACWAMQMPIFQPTGAASCNFTGVTFIPEEAPPLLSQPIIRLQTVSTKAPALPRIPRVITSDYDFDTAEINVLQDDFSDDMLLETDAESLLSPPPTHTHRQVKAEEKQSAPPYTPPAYLNCPEPPYPPRMKHRRTQGSVGVLIHINANGTPSAVIITDTSGNPQLDQHTRNWILQHWRFTPARISDSPRTSQVKTRIIYSIL